jgi:segregation and condensation protein B
VANLSVEAQLEAVLFVSPEPLSIAQLSRAIGLPAAKLTTPLEQLKDRLAGGSGLRLSHLDGRFRLVTAPEADPAIRRLQGEPTKPDLSRAALETLAIVAYRGPVTRSTVDALRGVASDSLLRNLVARGLVREAGRSPTPGRPVQYQVSQTFLDHFGLTSLEDLPALDETSESSSEEIINAH